MENQPNPATEFPAPSTEEAPARAWSSRDGLFLGLFFLAALGVLLLQWNRASYFIYPDALEYAQIGRNLSEGEGLTTQTIWSLRTAYTTELPARDFRRAPALPVLQSLVFRAAGEASDTLAILAAGLPFLLLPPFLYLLTFRIANCPLASAGAAGLLLLDKWTLTFVATGLTEPLFALVLLLAALALTLRRPRLALGLAAACLAFGQYTRPNAFTLLLPLLLVALLWTAPQRERLVRAGVVMVVFVVLTSPLLIQNAVHLGRLDYTGYQSAVLVNDTSVYPGDHYAERVLESLSPVGFILEHPLAFADKIWRHLLKNLEVFNQSTSPLVLGAAFLALLLWRGGGRRDRVLLFAWTAAGTSVLFYSVGEFEGHRFYVPFVPLWLAGAFALLVELHQRLKPPARVQGILLAAFVLVSLYPGLHELAESQAEADNRGSGAARMLFGEEVASRVDPSEVIAFDVPWMTGWYADRTSVWLPYHPNDMTELSNRLPVGWILLSGGVRDSEELDPAWRDVYDGRAGVPGFTRQETLPGGFVLFRRTPLGP